MFHDFDFHKVARFTERDVKRLLGNAGIATPKAAFEDLTFE